MAGLRTREATSGSNLRSISDMRAGAPQELQELDDLSLISAYADQFGLNSDDVATAINYAAPEVEVPDPTDMASLRSTSPPEMSDYSDERLLVEYADRNQLDVRDFAESMGYDTGSRNPIISGLKAGVDQGQGLMIDAAAGLKDAVLPGDNSADDVLEYGMEQEYQARLSGRADLDKIEDQTLGTALPYVGYQLGKLAPVATGIIAAGLAAPVVGTTAAAGTLVASSAVGLGALYKSSAADGDANPYQALAAAPIYGALERIVPLSAAKVLKGTKAAGTSVGGSIVKAGVVEPVTEVLQNEMEMLINASDGKGTLSDDQKKSARLNSAVAGFVGGVGISSGAAAVSGTAKYLSDTDEVNLADTDPNALESVNAIPDEEVMMRLESELDEANEGAVRNEVKATQDLVDLMQNLSDIDETIAAEKAGRAKGRPTKAAARARQITQENRAKIIADIESLNVGIEASRKAKSVTLKMSDYRRGVRKIQELTSGGVRITAELSPEELAVILEMHPEAEAGLLAAIEEYNASPAIEEEVDLAPPVAEETVAVAEEVDLAPPVAEEAVVEQEVTTDMFEGIPEYSDEVFAAPADVTIEDNEQSSAEKIQSVVDEEPLVTLEILEDMLAEEDSVINGGDTIAMSVGVDKLKSDIDSEQGDTGSARPNLDQGVISGVVRMLLNPKIAPTPIVYKGNTAKPDLESTVNNTEMMQNLYTALNAVIKQQGIVSNRNKNINKGKKNIADVGHGPGIKAENEALRASKSLSVAMDKAIEAAGGNASNVEAIIAAVKKRTNRVAPNSSINVPLFAEMSEFLSKDGRKKSGSMKGFTRQDELNTTVDTLLSSAFTKYLNNELDPVIPAQDVVRGKPKRRSYEKRTRVVKKKGKDPETVTNETILEEVVSNGGGIVEVLEAIVPQDGTGVSSGYAITLAGRIKDVLKKLDSEGLHTRIEFTPEKGEKSFDQTTRVVRLPSEATEEQVLHETLHASLAWFIDQNSSHPAVVSLIESLETVFSFVDGGGLADINMSKQYVESATEVVRVLKELYGDGTNKQNVLAAVNELIAYGSTMREFKDMLKFIKQDPSEATKTWKDQLDIVWQRFSELMSFAIRVENTVANRVIDNSLMLLEAAAIKDSKNEYDTTFVRGHKLYMKNWKGKDTTDSAPVDNDGKLMSDQMLESGRSQSLLSLIPTKALMDTFGLTEERYTKYVVGNLSKSAKAAGDIVRDHFPSIAGKWSYFDSKFMLKGKMRGLTDVNKVESRAGYQNVGDVMTMLDNSSPEKTQQFKDYLDGDSTALDTWRNPVEFKIAAEIILENHNAYLQNLTQEEQEYLDFRTAGTKLSDSLIYTTAIDGGSSSPVSQGNMAKIISAQTVNVDVDVDDDLFDLDIETNKREAIVYQAEITPVYGLPYKIMVGKGMYHRKKDAGGHLPITDGTYTVQEDTEYKLARVQPNKNKLAYDKVSSDINLSEKMESRRWTAAMRNTFNLMATKYAAKNFQRNVMIAGKEQGTVFNNAADLFAKTGIRIGEDAGSTKAVPLESVIKNNPSKKLIAKLRQGGWVKFPDNAAKHGDLAGKIVSGPVVTSMTDLMFNGWTTEYRGWMTFIRRFKKAKTTLNPGTHATNTLSNVIFAEMHGITMADVKTASKMFLMYKTMAHRLPPHQLEIMKAFLSSGAMLGSYAHSEVTKQHDQLAVENVLEGGDNTIFGKLTSWAELETGRQKTIDALVRGGRAIEQATVDVYSLEDNVFRLAAFIKKSGQLMEDQGISDVTPEILRESGDWARYAFVDYSNDSVALKNIRNTAIPFATWMYVMAPTLAKTVITKPWHATNLLIAIQAMSLFMNEMAGGDDEEFRSRNPDLEKTFFGVPFLPYTTIRVPGFGEDGTAYYVDLGAYFPFSTAGKTTPMTTSGIDWIPSMLRPSGPLISAIIIAMQGVDPYTGKELTNPLDSGGDKFKAYSLAYWDIIAPPALRSANIDPTNAGSLLGVARGDLDWQWKQREIWYKGLRGVLGLRFDRTNMYEQDESNRMEENALDRAFSKKQNQLETALDRRGGPISTEMYDAYERKQIELIERYEEEKAKIPGNRPEENL